MHSAHRLKEGAAFVDDHRVDVVPVYESSLASLEIIGRLRGEGGDEAHNSRETTGPASAPLSAPPSAISDSIVGADAHPDVAHGAFLSSLRLE